MSKNTSLPVNAARTLALARKELFVAVNSVSTYGVALFFLLFTSIWFFNFQGFFLQGAASFRSYFAAFPLAFILVVPALTMKSWAEERKTGSVELLLTLPLSEWDLVLGKFLSCLGLLTGFLVLSLPVVFASLPLGIFDGGVILCEYLGTFLYGAASLSLGLLLSSISKNQAAAFMGSAAVLLVIMLINQITFTQALPQWLSGAFLFISLNYHFESFVKGLLDSRDLLFFIAAAVLFLYASTRVLAFRKWR